jgi:ubiquinone/menaquinone biosynthesis C-methylase UbiE
MLFDGKRIPFDDDTFDAVTLVDVLHHADDPIQLLRESRRVSRRSVLIKDHTRTGILADATLRFMDRVGNARHGVALPYKYFSREEWDQAFAEVGLSIASWEKRLNLYPFPASVVFGRSLHFVAELVRRM